MGASFLSHAFHDLHQFSQALASLGCAPFLRSDSQCSSLLCLLGKGWTLAGTPRPRQLLSTSLKVWPPVPLQLGSGSVAARRLGLSRAGILVRCHVKAKETWAPVLAHSHYCSENLEPRLSLPGHRFSRHFFPSFFHSKVKRS